MNILLMITTILPFLAFYYLTKLFKQTSFSERSRNGWITKKERYYFKKDIKPSKNENTIQKPRTIQVNDYLLNDSYSITLK